jgi:hypothetical protein
MLDSRANKDQYDHPVLGEEKVVVTLCKETDADSAASAKDDSDSDLSPHHSGNGSASGSAQRAGRWTPDEKILFLYGLKRFGKGRWKKMSVYLPHRYVDTVNESFVMLGFGFFRHVPTTHPFSCFFIQNRSLVQIKSHAQKVLKRLEAGENVFRRLEENSAIVDSLIVQAAKDRDALGRGLASTPKSMSAISKRKNSKALQPPSLPGNNPASDYRAPAESSFGGHADVQHVATEFDDGRDSVIAAAALCQLSSLGSSWDRNHKSPLQRSFC